MILPCHARTDSRSGQPFNIQIRRLTSESLNHQKFPSIQYVPFCSAGTGDNVDLELLVDDFVTFCIAGESILIIKCMQFQCQLIYVVLM